jgi:uncharacterized membrane protein
MQTRVRFLGHPIHPMLVVFPLALFSTAVLFDVIYLITDADGLTTFSFWAIAAGVVGGLAAAIFGLIDWLSLPKETRAKRIGLVHGVGNVIIVGLFAVSWILRLNKPGYEPDVLAFLLGLVGVAMALVTAWLGGELVYRLRVAVDDDANLDAPSSLSSRAGTGVSSNHPT